MKKIVLVSITLVIASSFTWQCIGAWQDSQTTDEAVHLIAGRSYWQTGNFNINPEHPALFKLWASFPLTLLPQTSIDTNTEPWQTVNQWTIGAHYLYYGTAQLRYTAHALLFLGRFPMILIWLGLVLTLTLFSWRRWGYWSSLVVCTLIAYDPNLLGHGHLITNDIFTSWLYLGTFLAVRNFVSQPRWKTLVWLCLVFALAQLTKYSAVLLWVFVPGVLIIARWYHQPKVNWRWIGRVVLGCMIVSSLMTWAVYGFRIDRINHDPRIAQLWAERQEIVSQQALSTVPTYTQFFVRLTDPARPIGRFIDTFQTAPIPAYWYWRGLFSAASHNAYGHGAYLLGQTSLQGWWYYFPVALAVKTPIMLLVTLFSAVIFWLVDVSRRIRQHQPWRRAIPYDTWILVFPPVIFLLWSMTGHINIGLRHIFPTYVFFPLAAGVLLSRVTTPFQRFRPWLSITTVIIMIGVSTTAWPNTIGYYNGLIGGTDQGHRFVLDSNLDWNQDIWRLRNFLNQQHFPVVHIVLFGSIPTDRIFPESQPVLHDPDIEQGRAPTGVVAISAGQLYNVDGPFKWLRTYRPRWKIGSSINVYDFR